MAAHDHLQPQQLKLFMTGRELKDSITGSMDNSMSGLDAMWASKLKASKRTGMGHGEGTYASLQEHGWQGEGVGILHTRKWGAIPSFDSDELKIDDAHHRVAAAAHMEGLKTPRPANPKPGKNYQRTVYIPTWNRDEFPSQRPEGR